MSYQIMIRRLLICEGRKVLQAIKPDRVIVSSVGNVNSLSSKEGGVSSILRRTMASLGSRDLNYNDIVKFSSKNEIILIDVREPSEIQETGKLPGSTHIPLGDVPHALGMDANAFKEKYGIEKPGKDAPIVFSCRSGMRSNKALEKALALGFSNPRHYAGGWLDWEKNTKK